MTAERRRFPARADLLPRVGAFVGRRCRQLGATRQATLRLILIAEELFINTVTHGYAGARGRGYVTLSLRDAGAEVELLAEDAAPAFDPFEHLPPAFGGGDPRDAPVGGRGRVLMAGISSRHAYERRGRRNCVTVAVHKRRAPRRFEKK